MVRTTGVKKPEPRTGWRLTVDLVDGDEDFTIECDGKTAANQKAIEIVKQGWAVRDRSHDNSNVSHEIVPMHRIRRFVIFEKVD